MNTKIMLPIPVFLFVCTALYGQTAYRLDKPSTIVVNGSSNVSDWKLDVAEYQGELVLADTQLEVGAKPISGLRFTAPVAKMSGGRGPIMDNKVRKALKNEEHPDIQYTSDHNVVTEVANGKATIQSNGVLTIAGVAKDITMEVTGVLATNGETLKLTGSKALKMSTFAVERPTAFFGELTTNDEITINLDLTFHHTTENQGQ